MIDQQIENLHKLMYSNISGFVERFALYRRLYALSVIAYIREINTVLEELSSKLDSKIELSALEIKYDRYLDHTYWQNNWLTNNIWCLKSCVSDSEINQITDYLPNGEKGYLFTPEMVGSFKTALHQFCDEGKLEWKDILYAVNSGLKQMWSLLNEIKEKTKKPQNYLFPKFWEEFIECADKDDYLSKYNRWKEDISEVGLQNLRDKQMQMLVKVLSTDFLRFRPCPTKGEVDRCKLQIEEDSLESSFVLPQNIKEQCARFEYFISWKDPDKNILTIDYERLGRYTYEHYNEIENELYSIIEFDIVIDAIHEDMAKLKPNLEKYLKNYEEKTIKDLYKECAEILNCCQKHLRDEIRPTFLEEFLAKMLYDKDIKQEAQEKLGSAKFRKKYLCQIIAALSLSYVFKVNIIKSDLADTLGKKLVKPNSKSICDYIEDFQRERKGALYNWTRKIIDELKTTPFNYPSGLL